MSISNMKLGEKIRYLREVEGSLRGLGRPMTQLELVRAVRKEQGESISQSYVSQIEGGSRPHMTQSTRSLLAKFFSGAAHLKRQRTQRGRLVLLFHVTRFANALDG